MKLKKQRILASVMTIMMATIGMLFPVKAAAAGPSMELKVSNASASSVVLKWNKQSQAKSYQVYRSTKKTSGYKKIASTEKGTFKDENLREQKTYYYKVTARKQGSQKVASNTVSKVKVRGNYKKGTVYGPSMTERQRKQVKNAAAKFVNTKIRPGMGDYEKVEAAHDYLVNRCEYADSSRKNGANSAWGALIYQEAQCSGYSRAFKALCDAMDVKCYYVHATEKAVNPFHQWNIVRVGSRYYHMDVQCNDSSGFRAIYLVSDKTMKKIGLRWNTSQYPRCSKDYEL
ncbi:MAG: transglutaminase-like superfamily [Firmicutes bacterium]|nr:transglutaminase-like superfamily [Bacillota bacterium]